MKLLFILTIIYCSLTAATQVAVNPKLVKYQVVGKTEDSIGQIDDLFTTTMSNDCDGLACSPTRVECDDIICMSLDGQFDGKDSYSAALDTMKNLLARVSKRSCSTQTYCEGTICGLTHVICNHQIPQLMTIKRTGSNNDIQILLTLTITKNVQMSTCAIVANILSSAIGEVPGASILAGASVICN